MPTKIKEGHYVKNVSDNDGDVFYVYEVEDGLLGIESCSSGMFWDMCDPKHYSRCAKPKTCRQDFNALVNKYIHPFDPDKKLFRRFAKEFVTILRKHGDDIDNQF